MGLGPTSADPGLHGLPVDADGHLQDHRDWTPALAAQLAAHEGWTLTEAHLQVLYCVRQFYADFGHIPMTRPLLKYVMQQLGTAYDNAALMQLFHTGRVARTITRLAGVPKPPNCL